MTTNSRPRAATRALAAGLLALSAALAACEGPPPVVPAATAGRSPAAAAEMRLAPGDKIKVTVFGEDKLSGEYEIDAAGFVSVPLGGTVKAGGLTRRELELALAARLKGGFLRDPKVTVDVASFRPFYVLGEVEKSGEYPYRSGLNVLSALAVAGGPTYRASGTRVLITRAGEAAPREYPLSGNVPVFPGDIIKVPERFF